MTWGYDADVMRFLGPVGQGNIQDHAKALNRDISQERFEEHQKSRPIIFIAHSLGGLIVKGALFLSYLEGRREAPASINPRLAAIRMCTQGILFAGTPHQGSDKAKWAATATKLAWFIQKDQSTRLLDALERGSDVLETLQDNFKNILEGFAVYTLIEEIAYPKIGKIVEKDSARIGWHEIEVLIHANHSDMVKFASATDNDYKKVKYCIREIIVDRIQSAGAEFHALPRSPRSSSSWYRPRDALSRDDSRQSSDSTQQGLLTYRQQNSGLLGASSPVQQPLERSVERSTSRGSGSRFAESRGSQLSLADDVAYSMQQGKYYLQQQDRNDPQNLNAANENFMRARDMLLRSNSPDPAALVRALHQIINVRIEMSFNKGLRPEEKWAHVQTARSFGEDAFKYAQQSPNAGDVSLVKLQHAIMGGREAEVAPRLGATPQEVRRRKDEAIKTITASLDELQRSGNLNVDKHRTWAESWRTRLRQS
ncbi:hypothetical protein N7G274_002446 [Stereocaulon virgatum]|uniref:DUF676 domain-containing protein n=1 Tax=Stereocaulon virgatum TaxID=373712 RepID=A0ABR4AJ38_9LECA